mmetsp:Transcript_14140/g.13660  ORF Transcript_14140/g.13660 Transcript_14140/m.13660 type:complete len:193 (-) Transcript_14140:51-629(-)
MISEVANALFITYVATEYLIASAGQTNNVSTTIVFMKIFLTRVFQYILFFTIVINFVSIYHVDVAEVAETANFALFRLFHLPKIFFAASSFLLLLYIDCCRQSTLAFSNGYFLRVLFTSLLHILPMYPFLAALVSFGFLFIITVFEFLHLPLDYLNNPIYYGVLYGPLSLIYWNVKKRLVVNQEHIMLPINI